MSESAVRAAFLQQSEACRALGSPFTARLTALCAARLTPDLGRAAVRVLTWSGDPSPRGQAVPLRLMGGFHALVLSDRAPDLAAVYPPNEMVDDEVLWRIVTEALAQHDDWIHDWLDSPPQTNEVQRANGLFAGLSYLAESFDLPFVLSEVGSSAGLNLNLGLYGYSFAGRRLGQPDSLLQLAPEWRGASPPNGRVEVVARQGCDLNPLDLDNPEHRLRLKAFLWPDQRDRLARLQAAFEIATVQRPEIRQADAVGWIAGRLAERWPGHCHVIFHSIVLQYFPEAARAAFAGQMSRALSDAAEDAPVVWLQMESDGRRPGAALTSITSHDPSPRLLGRVDFHGRWVDWRS
ncbi:DUF2332 domain-containing protein [Algihabitans albus]|uniref:DUF2332 domain-containing protein n=1 Tax=Algihabitans albus TaxID=2164067 RepID=UPI000E5D49A5|nr:DUF2332 family protein [Algihabitans albus]